MHDSSVLAQFYGMSYAVVAMGLMTLAYLCYTQFYKLRGVDLIDAIANGNTAASLRLTGLLGSILFGLILIMMKGPKGDVMANSMMLINDGIILFGLLVITTFVNDWLIVTSLPNTKAIMEGNIAVGLTEMGSMFATAIIASGSMMNDVNLITTITFFIIGQLAMVAMVWVFSFIVWFNSRKTTKINLIEEVRQGNFVAGLLVCGFLVALGILMRGAVVAEVTDFVSIMVDFSRDAVVGTIFMLIWIWAVDFFLIHKITNSSAIKNKFLGPIFTVFLLQIGGAVMIVNGVM